VNPQPSNITVRPKGVQAGGLLSWWVWFCDVPLLTAETFSWGVLGTVLHCRKRLANTASHTPNNYHTPQIIIITHPKSLLSHTPNHYHHTPQIIITHPKSLSSHTPNNYHTPQIIIITHPESLSSHTPNHYYHTPQIIITSSLSLACKVLHVLAGTVCLCPYNTNLSNVVTTAVQSAHSAGSRGLLSWLLLGTVA
jgi:hypothetical protein